MDLALVLKTLDKSLCGPLVMGVDDSPVNLKQTLARVVLDIVKNDTIKRLKRKAGDDVKHDRMRDEGRCGGIPQKANYEEMAK